jgi:hypothetical protein
MTFHKGVMIRATREDKPFPEMAESKRPVV